MVCSTENSTALKSGCFVGEADERHRLTMNMVEALAALQG